MNPQVGQSNVDNVPNEVDLPLSVNPSSNIVEGEETMNVIPLFPLTPENPSEDNLSLPINSATNVVTPEYTGNVVELPFKRSSSDHASTTFVVGGSSNSAEEPAHAKRRETESRLSANKNTIPSLSLSSPPLSPPPQPPRVVREEHNFFRQTTQANQGRSHVGQPNAGPPHARRSQTTPNEENQGRSHVGQPNAGPPRARRSVNMIRASSYPTRPRMYQSQAQLGVRNRSSFTTGSPNIPRRNMLPNSNSNAGANATTTPLQGQGGTIPAGPSTNAQPRRTPTYEVQFLHDRRRSNGRYSQMLNIDNVAEELLNNIGDELLSEWFAGEHIFEPEANPRDELPQGLSEETIMQHLQSFTFLSIDDDINDNEKEKCPICLEEFENGNQVGRLHSCDHKYHLNCIKDWLVQRNFCPVCKRVALETNNNENHNGNA